jgi:hypothetical protein
LLIAVFYQNNTGKSLRQKSFGPGCPFGLLWGAEDRVPNRFPEIFRLDFAGAGNTSSKIEDNQGKAGKI